MRHVLSHTIVQIVARKRAVPRIRRAADADAGFRERERNLQGHAVIGPRAT